MEIASPKTLETERLPGLKLQEDLARLNISIPIILITALGDIHMAVKGMKAGAIDFLTKPIRERWEQRVDQAVASGDPRYLETTQAAVNRQGSYEIRRSSTHPGND